MRGGLDDALDKLARRDELRRRATEEATGTPPAVQELIEAIAGVVGRNHGLEVTVGVEGEGEPTLLHFFVEEGTVRVTADSSVAARMNEPRHADFDLEPEEHFAPASPASSPGPGFDDRDRFDPGPGYGYDGRQTDDLDADRFRSPFAPTPPPNVPPQNTHPTSPAPARNGFGEETTRLAYPDQTVPEQRPAAAPQDQGGLTPLPEPIPLRNVDSAETEQAAKRLAALLRDDPTLLRQDRR